MSEAGGAVLRRERKHGRAVCAGGTDDPPDQGSDRPAGRSDARRARPAAVPWPRGDEAQAARAHGRRLIWVVDDDESMREALEMLLESAGFEVEVFASAQSLLSSNRLSEVGCLIADVRMPGMSGFELQRELAATGSRIPIVFITAHGDDRSRARALRAGAAAFLLKPFSERALLDAVQAAL